MKALCLAVSLSVAVGTSVAAPAGARTLHLDRIGDLTLVAARAEAVVYQGQRAVPLRSRLGHEADDDSMLAIVPNSDFKDGTIDLDVSGAPIPEVPNARGFIGVAFRVQAHADSFECFYIRPSNARCDDQQRRNHSVQYTCGEAYADMEPGVWTHLKVEVAGTKARLYVNRAPARADCERPQARRDTRRDRALVPHVHRRLFREPDREVAALRTAPLTVEIDVH